MLVVAVLVIWLIAVNPGLAFRLLSIVAQKLLGRGVSRCRETASEFHGGVETLRSQNITAGTRNSGETRSDLPIVGAKGVDRQSASKMTIDDWGEGAS